MILEHGPVGDRTMRIVSRALILLMLVNTVAVVLESVPRYAVDYAAVFAAIEIISTVVFTTEYLLRLWVATEHAPNRELKPGRARLRYATSTDGLVDLVSVLPFWLAFVIPFEFRIILLVRTVRFLKLARYSPALRSLLDALYSERRALFGCVVILLGTTLITASFMHLVERDAQPDKFGSIPRAMWWAIVTLATVGYGDVVPSHAWAMHAPAERSFARIVMFALPAGIVAKAFAEEIRRRDFVAHLGHGGAGAAFPGPRRRRPSPTSCGY